MATWIGLLLRGGLAFLKAVLREAVEGVTAGDVEGAKAEVEAAIQRHRRLPGTVRRWICQDVRRVEAATVAELKLRLHTEINRL